MGQVAGFLPLEIRMHAFVRGVFGILLGVAVTSGCRGDVVAGDAEDAPTRDSLLSLSVLKAHETILPEVEAPVPTTDSSRAASRSR